MGAGPGAGPGSEAAGPGGPSNGADGGPGGAGGQGFSRPKPKAPPGFEVVEVRIPGQPVQFDLQRVPTPIPAAVQPAPLPAPIALPAPVPAPTPQPAPAEAPLGNVFLGAVNQSAGNTRSAAVNQGALGRARQAGVADDRIVTQLVSSLGNDASRIV